MPPRKNSNIESITEEYIDGAVKVHVKASEVPPRQNLNISFKDADKLGDEVTLSNQEAYEESHGKIYEMTHNNTVPWRNWAFYLILVSMLTVCFTFAKYASFASGNAQTAVAKFDVEVVGLAGTSPEGVTVTPANPNQIPDPGDETGNISVSFTENSGENVSQTISFTVTNRSDVKIRVANVTWVSSNATNLQHNVTVSPTTTDKIDINDDETINLTIEKFTDTIPSSYNGTLTESGTLTIFIEQVD